MPAPSANDERQRRLPLTREERFTILARVDPTRVGISSRAWPTVRELLRQIEFCGGSDEKSFAKVETLAFRLGRSERSVQRARALAVAAGLVAVQPRWHSNGQSSNLYAVQWDRLAALASPMGDMMTGMGDMTSPMGDITSPLRKIENSTKESRYKVEGDQKKTFPKNLRSPSRDQLDHAQELATRIVGKLGKPREPRDRELAIKLGLAVATGEIPEAWLHSAVYGTELKRATQGRSLNAWGYATTCLKDECLKRGRSLGRVLGAVALPPECDSWQLADPVYAREHTPAEPPQ